jgi:hypothetical protein
MNRMYRLNKYNMGTKLWETDLFSSSDRSLVQTEMKRIIDARVANGEDRHIRNTQNGAVMANCLFIIKEIE